MKYKLVPNYFSVIIVIIVGAALFKQIDFKTMTVDNLALSAVYLIAFLISIGFMIKKKTNS
ncbi:hypothetical protein [Maribacter hydrothermalis]|uniref:Uncharacterized protein n=1 Tax=Maribacter hydrothermalis TaxID=1836467 RepID=A0A1B7ZDV0_9FLAO|nr:hypothetical protein [Maribacter hydrothermalis]APQ16580.1 hypothetical protein BTR34_04190 [Maribacter hydrothermalis]OBR41515.1 hypothetical protein A9200_12845 [Maribacter hydrothermalis]